MAQSVSAGHFDELIQADGELRPGWREFFRALGTNGLADLPELEARLKQRIEEDGVTYNVYADSQSRSRRWSLDLLPFIVEQEDWSQIEPALRQRARLLEGIVRDIYTGQSLLREGLLPPALVLGNPAYLRAMHGVEAAGGRYLSILAFDLARGPDGRWWVLGHRSQAPSGLGYALENRIIIGRLFPGPFAQLQVQRLAASCHRLLQDLIRRAARVDGADGPPRVILLTPGRYNETYFEQSYLAHYLGIPLVEGRDLTVRQNRVYLKTLRGLERVHAIIRRVDDWYCDPLELNPESALGVPGLVQTVRAGQVLLANALGSAVIETPALQGFLPTAAKAILGEDLLLPPRDSWWCGEPAAREHAFAQLKEVRVRGTYRGWRPTPQGAEGKGLLDLSSLRARIHADPDDYTIQSYLPYSKTPCFTRRGLVPRSAVLRFYAVADEADGWHIIPGGLTRIAERQDQVSMQRGGSSADTWVITGDPPDTFSLLRRGGAGAAPAPQRRVVSSRIAENLYWLGRYTERLENAARLAQQILAAEFTDEVSSERVVPALAICAAQLGLVSKPDGDRPELTAQRLLMHLQEEVMRAMGEADSHSLLFDMNGLVNCADQIRERLSLEHWQQVAQARECLATLLQSIPMRRADILRRAFAPLLLNLAAITADQTDGMTRDDGWQLLAIGRQIERLQNLCHALLAHLSSGAVQTEAGFDQLLLMFRSTMTYRSRYPGQRHLSLLFDLLVFDAENPRSLACAVDQIRLALEALERAAGMPLIPERVLEPVGASIQSGTGHWEDLAALELLGGKVVSYVEASRRLSEAIEAGFFIHTRDAGRPLSST